MAEKVKLCRDVTITVTAEKPGLSQAFGDRQTVTEDWIDWPVCSIGHDEKVVLEQLDALINGYCKGEGYVSGKFLSAHCEVSNERKKIIEY